MIRVLIAGIVGGLAMFLGGAFSHLVMELETRAIKRMPSEAEAGAFFDGQVLRAGMYGFPQLAEDYDALTPEDQAAEVRRHNDAFRSGPAGYIVVAPTGEAPMGPPQLGGELIANILAALLAAFIAAHFTLNASFARRWALIVLLAPTAWLTMTLSYAIWYRFPVHFIRDGLFAALIEWTLAGAIIAAIVQPIMHSRAAVSKG